MTQEELDRIKWEKSVNLGFDACGSFDFCTRCDKYQSDPCIKAFNKYNGVEEKTMVVELHEDHVVEVEPKKVAEKPATTTATKATKKPSTKSATKTTAKAPAKKTTAKASTTKKTTTKASTTKAKTTKK